jgi:hypothetical protein
MARYKEYSYSQGKFIPIHFGKQILPGTFEYTLNYLIDNELDLSIFDKKYKNNDTGASCIRFCNSVENRSVWLFQRHCFHPAERSLSVAVRTSSSWLINP